MEGLLLRIKMLLNENTERLVKRIDKLDAKFETLANRVRNLERRKPKVEKLKQDEPDFVLNSCSCFQNYDMEMIRGELQKMEYQKSSKLSRKQPQLFQKVCRQLFSRKEDCNIYLKGTRIYQYRNKTWNHVHSQKDFLNLCRKNIWEAFNEICQDVLSSHQGWEKVYRPIIYENIGRECPLLNAGFRDLLSKSCKRTELNRFLFK
jgi:hypothetical protein